MTPYNSEELTTLIEEEGGCRALVA